MTMIFMCGLAVDACYPTCSAWGQYPKDPEEGDESPYWWLVGNKGI